MLPGEIVTSVGEDGADAPGLAVGVVVEPPGVAAVELPGVVTVELPGVVAVELPGVVAVEPPGVVAVELPPIVLPGLFPEPPPGFVVIGVLPGLTGMVSSSVLPGLVEFTDVLPVLPPGPEEPVVASGICVSPGLFPSVDAVVSPGNLGPSEFVVPVGSLLPGPP